MTKTDALQQESLCGTNPSPFTSKIPLHILIIRSKGTSLFRVRAFTSETRAREYVANDLDIKMPPMEYFAENNHKEIYLKYDVLGIV